MDDAIVLLKKALIGINTGRVRSALLEPVRVEAYGDMLPISHIATVSAGAKPRTLVVSPFDPSLVGKIRKAILAANLGLNPQVAGTTLLVPVPAPDLDQRNKLELRAKSLSEQQRVAVRNVRKDVRNKAKRDGLLDQIKSPLEDLTKRKIQEIDSLLKSKVEDINWTGFHWGS